MEGVVNDDDVPNDFPPVAELNQAIVLLAGTVAVIVSVPVPQRAFPVATGISG